MEYCNKNTKQCVVTNHDVEETVVTEVLTLWHTLLFFDTCEKY